jgi:hypothetical protein
MRVFDQIPFEQFLFEVSTNISIDILLSIQDYSVDLFEISLPYPAVTSTKEKGAAL